MSFELFMQSVLMKQTVATGGGGSITYVGGDKVETLGFEIAATNDLTPTLPTHQADDFALLFAMRYSPTSATISTPSGWTKIDENYTEAAANRFKTAVFYKKFTSSSESDPTVTLAGSTGGGDGLSIVSVVVFRGVDTSTPFDVTYSTGSHFLEGNESNDSATFCPLPTITTTTNNCAIYVVQGQDGSSWSSQGAPTGYTQTWASDVNKGAGQEAYIEDCGAAGLQDPDFTNVSDGGISTRYGGYIFALRPA